MSIFQRIKVMKTLKQLREKELTHFDQVESEHDRKERMRLTNSILIAVFGDLPMSSDTRRNLRVPYSVSIKAKINNKLWELETIDLGLKGVSVNPIPALSPDTPVSLQMSLKHKAGMMGNYEDIQRNLTGYVTWFHESDKRFGIEFTNMTQENLALVWDTIEYVIRSRC